MAQLVSERPQMDAPNGAPGLRDGRRWGPGAVLAGRGGASQRVPYVARASRGWPVWNTGCRESPVAGVLGTSALYCRGRPYREVWVAESEDWMGAVQLGQSLVDVEW